MSDFSASHLSDVSNAKQERQARMWTYERLIGLRGLIDAYQHGCREYHETAEFLDVTEEQLRDAIADYRSKYGVCTKYQNYYIMFEPYLMIGKKNEDNAIVVLIFFIFLKTISSKYSEQAISVQTFCNCHGQFSLRNCPTFSLFLFFPIFFHYCFRLFC